MLLPLCVKNAYVATWAIVLLCPSVGAMPVSWTCARRKRDALAGVAASPKYYLSEWHWYSVASCNDQPPNPCAGQFSGRRHRHQGFACGSASKAAAALLAIVLSRLTRNRALVRQCASHRIAQRRQYLIAEPGIASLPRGGAPGCVREKEVWWDIG